TTPTSPAPSTPTTYPLSLHDALPISMRNTSSAGFARHRAFSLSTPTPPMRWPPLLTGCVRSHDDYYPGTPTPTARPEADPPGSRSEEHTSELQSRSDLVCRLLLEKK